MSTYPDQTVRLPGFSRPLAGGDPGVRDAASAAWSMLMTLCKVPQGYSSHASNLWISW
jgi:hypothetical protein